MVCAERSAKAFVIGKKRASTDASNEVQQNRHAWKFFLGNDRFSSERSENVQAAMFEPGSDEKEMYRKADFT
jgi:hypothetical protein